MNICIITEPLSANYGGILQNYALQTVLKRLGHNAYTFDVGRFSWLDWILHSIAVTIHKAKGEKVHYLQSPYYRRKRENPLRKFALRHIDLVTPRQHKLNLRCLDKYDINAFVIGSDQVWRPLYNHDIEDKFLDFAKSVDCIKIAYAASFGTDEWEFTKEQSERCSVLAKQFDGISVREFSGIKLCKKYLKVDAIHVLDPTLLLNKNDYSILCSNIKSRSPFVFAYLLNKSTIIINRIETYAQSRNLPCIIKYADEDVRPDDSIEKWISYFRDAECVITDSFHGTIFSIIFNKEFVSLGNDSRGNARFTSLLNIFNLQNRLSSDIFMVDTAIDWNKVEETINKQKIISYNWLLNYLTENERCINNNTNI